MATPISIKEDNATYLFEKPARHWHNSESWWSAFFSIFWLYQAKHNPDFSLPIYTYETGRYWIEDALPCAGVTYSDIQVEARLTGEAFGLSEWPDEFYGLKPDVAILQREQRQLTLVEVKTIGASVAGNFELYPRTCAHLGTCNWRVTFCYLLSYGHESSRDWKVITEARARFILWEDVLRAVIETPLRDIFDLDLTPFAQLPDEPVVAR
jgi:hypothetical protein